MNENVSIQLGDPQTPLYIQVFKYFEKMIVQGKLAPGCKLPPIRKLAGKLGVNNVTVVNAYKLLEQNGYVHSKKGSGTYVGIENAASDQNEMDIPVGGGQFFEEEDIQLMSRGHITLSEHSINFASAAPTPDLFPIEDFKQVLIKVLDRDRGNAFGYDESNGYRPLRESISQFMDNNYAIKAHKDDIQIISGAQQGIDIIAKALINPGDFVLVENPIYTGAIAVFRSRGAKIIGVPMEQDGMNMHLLEKYIEIYRPKLVYTMPYHQNPTTFCYSKQKKQHLLDLAYQNKLFVIEDDFSSDLNFEAHGVSQPLKVLDRQERVLYIKSFSKVLMPGLRIGFLIAPAEVFKRILQAKHTTDISSSGLIQRALDLYLKKQIWGKHLAYMKGIFQDRYRKILQETMKLEDIGIKRYRPAGGLNLWLTLPEGISGTRLYQACAKRDVLLIPGKIFYVDNDPANDQKIRMSFAAVYPDQIEKGIEVVHHCMEQLKNKTEDRTTYYSPLI